MINDILSAKILCRYSTDLWLSFRISFPVVEKNWKATSIVFYFMFKFWKNNSKDMSSWLWVGDVTSKGQFIIAPKS